LMAAQHKASETLYKQSTAGGGAGEPGGPETGAGAGHESGGSKPDGDVIDAEVVDDDKK